MKEQGLNITNQKPIMGTVRMSGDSVSSLITIISGFFISDTVKVKNVPRSSFMLRALEILEELGIKHRWDDLDKLTCLVNGNLRSDLTNIDRFSIFNITKLLIPLMLYRESKCVIGLIDLSEAKFYKNNGFIVSQIEKKFVISVPNFLPIITNVKSDHDDVLDQASKLFLNYIYEDSIKIDFDNNNLTLKKCLEIKDKSANYENQIRINSNIDEFAFYSTLVAISRGEAVFENVLITEVLEFLILLEKLGVKYEYYSDKLKIWATDFYFENYYDLTGIQSSVIGYFLIMIFRHNHNKNIKVLVKRTPTMNKIIRDLNILGLEVSSRNINEDTNYELLNLKIIKTIVAIKTPILDEVTGGLIICAAVAFTGNHKINDISNFAKNYPYLNDNLSLLQISYN